jgi:hypothetical protein
MSLTRSGFFGCMAIKWSSTCKIAARFIMNRQTEGARILQRSLDAYKTEMADAVVSISH